MLEARGAFFVGRVIDLVVRNGTDAQLSSAHATYREMILQIARDYAGLPDVRTLTLGEIAFFYEGLRAELRRHTGRAAAPEPSKRTAPRKRRATNGR